MNRGELKKVLKDLGYDNLSDEQIDSIFETIDTNHNDQIEYIEFVHMYGNVKEKGIGAVAANIETVKGASLRMEASGIGTGGHHTYAAEEVSVSSRFINNALSEDSELSHCLPIDPDNEDLFYNMSNGQILIKLINLADPEAVDMRTVNKYKENMNIFEVKQNIIQALTSAKGIIRLVGINDDAFLEKNKLLILSVLTQLMKVIAVKEIDLRNCEELYRLL